MTARKHEPWSPDWVVPPGEILQEKLDEMGLTQRAAAERMGVSEPYLNGIVRGHRAITPRVAIRLEALTEVTAEFWAALWTKYALAVERGQVERAS